MRGKDHIAISTGSALLLAAPWLLIHPVQVAIFIGGVIIGSLLPDTDATDSKLHHMDGIARIFSLIMRPVVIPATKLVYRVFEKSFNPAHRGSMHTLPGVIVYTLILALLIGSALYLLGFWNIIIGFFFLGLFAGGIFHILEDCCTRSGLMPFKPFSDRKYAGSINTGSRVEVRPGLYASVLLFAAIGLVVAGITYAISHLAVITISICLFAIIWVLILKISRV
ncbi:metal-dependent hydrolase [Methanocalculus taiwanensis]|uniref:Metal-dependent hydrolase n=1 Tax=Methanocalculus taiwanensis TaxID=106207 RepID=A0ABD4TGK2_9EURY|nr:metal-dependent hydrolase [Methanocalculus taiwanensis]MCQ1537861.1 metal-dependent hydrolase [Methanocalculus taiwanensis]